MNATTERVKKRKPRKPQWTQLSPDRDCSARCDEAYGFKTVRIKGYPIKPAKVKQLAKWFADAEKWLDEKEKDD